MPTARVCGRRRLPSRANTDGGVLGTLSVNQVPSSTRTPEKFASSSSESSDDSSSGTQTTTRPPKVLLISKLADSPVRGEESAHEEHSMSDISVSSHSKDDEEQESSESTHLLRQRPLFHDEASLYGADDESVDDESEADSESHIIQDVDTVLEERDSFMSAADGHTSPENRASDSDDDESLQEDDPSVDSDSASASSLGDAVDDSEEENDDEYVPEEVSSDTEDEDLDADDIVESPAKKMRGNAKKADKVSEKEEEAEDASISNGKELIESIEPSATAEVLVVAEIMDGTATGEEDEEVVVAEVICDDDNDDGLPALDDTDTPVDTFERTKEMEYEDVKTSVADESERAADDMEPHPGRGSNKMIELIAPEKSSTESLPLEENEVGLNDAVDEPRNVPECERSVSICESVNDDGSLVNSNGYSLASDDETEDEASDDDDEEYTPDESPIKSEDDEVDADQELMSSKTQSSAIMSPPTSPRTTGNCFASHTKPEIFHDDSIEQSHNAPRRREQFTTNNIEITFEDEIIDAIALSQIEPIVFPDETLVQETTTVAHGSAFTRETMKLEEATLSNVGDDVSGPVEQTNKCEVLLSAAFEASVKVNLDQTPFDGNADLSAVKSISDNIRISSESDALTQNKLVSPNRTLIGRNEKSSEAPEETSSDGEIDDRKERDRRPRLRRFRSEGAIKPGKWATGSKIGVGSFGVVHVGMNKKNGTLMAVKSIEVAPSVMTDIRTEINLLKSLDHINIVRYFGAETDGSHLHIFQEWVPGGSVTSLLQKFGPFSMQVVRSYLFQIVSGLSYLHNNRILHRDIKGGNVLVSDAGIVKLADFGSSKRMAQKQLDVMENLTMRGTPYFMAPEVFEEKYGTKADVWSVGCVAFQMATGSPPWKEMGFTSAVPLFRHLKDSDGIPDFEWNSYDQEATRHFKVLLKNCFNRDPDQRPSAKDLFKETFFTTDVSSSECDQGRGLFSPSEGSQSTWGSMRSLTPAAAALYSPSPKSKAIKGITPFISPPLPKRIYQGALRIDVISPLPPSPIVDSSEWPSWARKKLESHSKSPYKMRAATELDKPPTNSPSLMDSLALSEDSSSAANPFRRSARKSGDSSLTSMSSLAGVDFLEKSAC